MATAALVSALALVGCSSSAGPKPAAGASAPTTAATSVSGSATVAAPTTAPVTSEPAAAPTTSGATSSSSASASSTATSSTTTASSTTASSTTAPPATPAPPVQNLTVSDDLRAQLVAAGAALNGLSPSDYLGLAPGITYYAYDSATQTYWAAGALDPSPSSMPAQVASQDDGSYLIFSQPSGGTWTAQNDGFGGVQGTPCPPIPPSVVAVWGWPAGTCQPPD